LYAFLSIRLLWTLGSQVLHISVAWMVYQLAEGIQEGALDLGLMGLVQFIPVLLLWPVAGSAADQYSRKTLLALCALGHATMAVLLGFIAPQTDTILLLMAGIASMRAFSAPASQSLIPQLVSGEQFGSAVALSSSVFQIGSTAGPALGGLLCEQLGPAKACYLSAALIGVAALLTGLLPNPPSQPAAREGVWKRALEGYSYLRSRRELLGAILLDLFAVLLGGATALLPIFAEAILEGGPKVLGWLRAAPAVGAALTAFALSRYPIQAQAGKKLLVVVAIYGVATVVFGLSTWLPLSLLALFITGAADEVSVVIRQTIVQTRTPDHLRGRVSAVNFLFISVSNEIGALESGLTAAWLGPVRAVVMGGVGSVVMAVAFWRVKELREVDKP
jgi:predicted MFS family arabinose efflux permease